jgi:hypothetical protein
LFIHADSFNKPVAGYDAAGMRILGPTLRKPKAIREDYMEWLKNTLANEMEKFDETD